MNKAEALKILDLKDGASDDEVKKKFRKLAFSKHPDRNKEEGAEDEYKKLSSAYEYLKNPPPEPKRAGFRRSTQRQQGGIWDAFFGGAKQIKVPPHIQTSCKISFKDSVLGCNKKIRIKRIIKCDDCSGQGQVTVGDSCSGCRGLGTVTETLQHRGGYVTVQRMCTDCDGRGGDKKDCSKCSGSAGIKTDSDFDVEIKGGILSGQKIRLPGAGNYYSAMGMAQSTDIFLIVRVDRDPDMRIVGNQVISTLEVTLYEALKGTTKKVRTVMGERSLEIRSGARHQDKVSLTGHGVRGIGDHSFTLNVQYPEDTIKLIEALEDKPEIETKVEVEPEVCIEPEAEEEPEIIIEIETVVEAIVEEGIEIEADIEIPKEKED